MSSAFETQQDSFACLNWEEVQYYGRRAKVEGRCLVIALLFSGHCPCMYGCLGLCVLAVTPANSMSSA